VPGFVLTTVLPTDPATAFDASPDIDPYLRNLIEVRNRHLAAVIADPGSGRSAR
jgi:hypothetical protein